MGERQKKLRRWSEPRADKRQELQLADKRGHREEDRAGTGKDMLQNKGEVYNMMQ